MKDSYVEIMYIRKKSSFNRTILSTFSFPEYCFVHYCLVLLHKTLSSAWTSPLFLVSFYSILYLLDVNQICICTSCSCSFTFIMKFYYKCICILYESSLYYLYSSYCHFIIYILHIVLKNYMLIIAVFYSLCLFSIEFQTNPFI